MKKIFFAFVAFVLGIAQANAQSITFDNVELPENGQKELVAHYSTGGKTIVSYGFTIKLPEGLSFVMTDGEPNVTYEGGKGVNLTYKDGNFGFLPKNDEVQITGEGVLLKLTLQAGENLKQNDEFEVEVTSLGMTDSDLKDVTIANTQFTVKIVENRVTLDETVGVTDKTPTGTQNVLVKRTIKKDNWSTLCLPFSMNEEQIANAFGSDVMLADYTGWTWEEDDDANMQSITIKFTSCSTISENKPLVIKTSSNISEFKVDGVTINPDDAEIEIKESVDNKRKGTMIGTYNANTVLDDEDYLFLSGNNFYYSNGSTTMKAFRAYFDLYYSLDAPYKNKVSASNVKISIDDESTSIEGFGYQRVVEGVYDLSGRKIQLEGNDLNKLQKGVYIIDGKKVTIK